MYRIASISKLLAVYTLLLEINDKYWDRAVTNFIPELRALVPKNRSDPIGFITWDEVTLGSPTGQVAGVTRDRKCFPRLVKHYRGDLVAYLEVLRRMD